MKASINTLTAHHHLVAVVRLKEVQAQKEETSTAEATVVHIKLRIPQAQTMHIPHHLRAPLDKITRPLHQGRITDHLPSQNIFLNHHLNTTTLLPDPHRHQNMLLRHHLRHPNPNIMLLLDTPPHHLLQLLSSKHRSLPLHPNQNPLHRQLPRQSPPHGRQPMLQQAGRRLEKKLARERRPERRQTN